MNHIKKALAYQFLKLHLKLIDPLQESLRPLGITVKNFNMMQLIEANPGISQNRLAEILQKDKTLIGQVVDKLEEKKLAKREAAKNDRRVYALSLTVEGQKIVNDYGNMAIENETSLLTSLSAGDEVTLRRILNQLMEQL